MTEKPPEDEKPDDARFHQTLENMLKTPAKPHKDEPKRQRKKR